MDIIINLLQWVFPNIQWLGLIVALCIFTWFLSRWVKELSETTKKVKELPCSSHAETIANHTTHTEEHDRRITSVENKIDRWDDRLIDIALSNAQSAQKNSPYRLTPFGEHILEKCFGRQCIDDNREYLFSAIDALPNSTPYDVERAAILVILDSFRSGIFNSVKNFLYNSPAEISFNGENKRLSTSDIQVAMAIYLRDLYMEDKSHKTKIVVSQTTI